MAAYRPDGLPPSMKAQFLDAFNTPYALRSTPLPAITTPYDILIKVDAASYCHTDAVLAAGQMLPNPPSLPHVGCHEFAGTVVGLPPTIAPGSESESSFPVRIGDRVGVPGRSFHPCGKCSECAAGPTDEDPSADPPGYSVYCPHALNHGISSDGGFREYAVVDVRQVARIPDSISAVEAAAFMCAGITIYGALKRCFSNNLPVSSSSSGQRRVGIIGCGGGLGHLGLQFAAKMGYKVVGVDNADAPLELSRALDTGAWIVDSRDTDADDVVAKIGEEDGKTENGDMGLDAVIILPESQKAFDYGVRLLRNHGRCVIVSFPERGFHVSARDVVFRDISIVGSLVGSNTLMKEMLDFAETHVVRAAVKTFSLARLNELVEEYNKGYGGKLVVDMALRD
jgi:D-arabinose 1-dehydrogenase-like Zn-dependent alcohol dehydrogenase